MKWNPINTYEDCPEIPGTYLIKIDSSHGHHIDDDYWDGWNWRSGKEVSAWAEMPEPSPAGQVVHLDIEDVVHKPRKDVT